VTRSVQVAFVAIAIILAFGAGAVLYRHLHPGGQPAASDAPAELVAPVAGIAKRAVPDSVPDFSLKDLEGRPHSIREWSGRPLVINFWATWCGPCRDEIPLLQRLRRERAADRLEVVGIAVDFHDDVQAFLKKTPIDYPVLVGEENGVQVAASLGIIDLALPFTVFADHDGRILVLRLGQLHEDQAKLILDTLREVDSGRLPLPEGKARVAAGLRNARPAPSPAKPENPA
jgi:thiol-disulfide isomerase/thioredoxin